MGEILKEKRKNPYPLPHYTKRQAECVICGYEENRKRVRELLFRSAQKNYGEVRSSDISDPVVRTAIRREKYQKMTDAVEEALRVMMKKYPLVWGRAENPLLVYRAYEYFSCRTMETKKPQAGSYRTWKRQRAEMRYYVAKNMGWVGRALSEE